MSYDIVLLIFGRLSMAGENKYSTQAIIVAIVVAFMGGAGAML